MMDNFYTFKFNHSKGMTALKDGQFGSIDYYYARTELFNLSLMADYDQLVCLPTLTKLDKHWYQIETARKVLRQLGGRALLADEVELGKTIEAGLILSEYLVRGMIQSILVLTPASLVSQWQMELAEKFNCDTVTTDDKQLQPHPDDFWTSYHRIIASLNTAKSPKHFNHVTARSWDLVIVDEAHHLKNRSTLNWKLVNTLNNYDLPWNPMKIEQRIGRIDRIGQTQDVFIFNFCLSDSIEEYILRILHDKINMFELVVGEIGFLDAKPEITRYIWCHVAYTAEADEKRIGMVSFIINELTGVTPVEIGGWCC